MSAPDDPPAPRRRRTNAVAGFEILGWLLAGAITVVAAIALIIDSHFKCGGTIGFMEPADLFRDEQCFSRRRRLGLLPIVLYGLAVGLRIYVVDRRQRRELGALGCRRWPFSRRRAARGEGR